VLLPAPIVVGDIRELPTPEISPIIDPVVPLNTLTASAEPPSVEPRSEARSPATERPPNPESKLPLSTDNGSDSRDPPKIDDGARARTDASVSKERRLRRFDDEASVMIDALSVHTPWAVAALYDTGWRRPGTIVLWPWDSKGAEYICGGAFGLW